MQMHYWKSVNVDSSIILIRVTEHNIGTRVENSKIH
jgi:hypothetical protein